MGIKKGIIGAFISNNNECIIPSLFVVEQVERRCGWKSRTTIA